MNKKIGLIGGNGFIGFGFSRFLSKNDLDFDIINRKNYDNYINNYYDILINANGNSKKYLAIDEPKEEFFNSVNSVQKSLVDFSYSTYVLCSTIDVYDNVKNPDKNTEDTIINTEELSKYGIHKYLSELLVKNYSNKWLIIRLGGLVGDELKKNAVYDLINNIPLRVSKNSSYQYMNTNFIPSSVFELLDKNIKNQIFNICGNGLISLNEINSYLEKNIIYNNDDVPLETYDINIDKIKKHIQIPDTKKSIIDYLKKEKNKL